MSEERKYIFPVDELDKIIEQMNQGIQPMISDEMMMEVRLRIKEIENLVFDDDEEYDESDGDDQKKHREMLQAQLEKERKKATQHDVIILEISPEQKQKIREQMQTSIVRPNPELAYHKTDDQVYKNTNNRKIMEKLKGLKNCYYNQKDWINAMKIIMEAIEISLGKYGDSDYPWLSFEEAKQQFREHKIRLTYPIPKLYINHSTILADKELLKGILTGDVVLKDKKAEQENIEKTARAKKKNKLPSVPIDYTVISDEEYDHMTTLHRAGYETPLSPIISLASRTYNPTSMPFGNRFARVKARNTNKPVSFDWAQDGAGEEYFDLIHGRKTDIVDIMRFLNDENSGMLNNSLSTNAQAFLRSMKYDTTKSGGYDYYLPNYMQQTSNSNPNINENAAKIEQDLLASIRMNNPTK